MGDKYNYNLPQYQRIRILDKLLATRKLTKLELIDAVIEEMESTSNKQYSYSPRTFENDKNKLQEKLDELNDDEGLEDKNKYKIEIIREYHAGSPITYYRYSHPEISVFESKLDKNDVQSLMDAVQFIQQIKGFKWDFDIQYILKKIDQRINFQNKNDQQVIGLQNLVADGYQYLNDIYLSIIEKRVITFEYEPFKEEKSTKTVHPYFIKQYNNRWFLLGFDESRGGISNFPLDRIKSKPHWTSVSYKSPENIFHANDYFKDIIGVTNHSESQVENIILSFSRERAPYVLTKKIHESQEIVEKKKDGTTIIKLHVKQNFELKSFILSHGSDVTVLKPESLAREIEEEANEIKKNYAYH
jgi:hypothetical protein